MNVIAATSRLPLSGVSSATGERLRTDIQAMRGYAVLIVVIQHAQLSGLLHAGHFGVDIFFVISGYLITGIIQRALRAGTFTFAGFYARRAKRLLPAAYVTFGATALLSTLFLTRSEMRDFSWQMAGAVTFTGNFALWLQTGYFEGAARLKPFLHVWSLSVEEQYYLLLPAALVLTPRRMWTLGTSAVLAVSLALCLVLVLNMPGATFYLLPTRAWELAVGSLGILALEGSPLGRWLGRLFWPALAALLLVPILPASAPHPGIAALLVCVATLVVILRRHPILNQGLPAKGLARLGDLSYSLYLVHWPILAFAATAWVTPIPGIVRGCLVILALLAAWVLYHYVEDPIRRASVPVNGRTLGLTLSISVMLILAPVAILRVTSSQDEVNYAFLRRGNLGLSDSCEFGRTYVATSACQTSATPQLLVWGDSYAMHLVDGIVASTNVGIAQATKSTCGPFADVAPFNEQGAYNRAWGRDCLAFNDSVLAYIKATPSLQTVVLASLYAQYLPGSHLLLREQHGGRASQDGSLEEPGSEDLAAGALGRTIDAVRKLGKKVVLAAPPPSAAGVDIGRCLELKAQGKAILGSDNGSCTVSEARYRTDHAPVLKLLDRVSREDDVSVIHLEPYLCSAGTCAVESDGVLLYRDQSHLSHDGSRLLGRKINLAGLFVQGAR